MLTPTKTLLTAGIVLGSSAFVMAAPAMAQEDVSLSANVALVSEYRFRGVALDDDPAIQGGIDAGYNGFYAGTWASSIDGSTTGDTELDVYGGWGTDLNGINLDLGFLYYLYPGESGLDYYELYASVGSSIESFDWTLGAAYSPDQDNLGDEDILYLYGDVGFAVPDSPFYLGGHLGYEEGPFAQLDGDGSDKKLDWSLTAGVTYEQWDISVSYVDTDESTNVSDAGVVFAVGASF